MTDVVKEKTFTAKDFKQLVLIFLGLAIVAFVFTYGFAAGGFITVASWIVFGGGLLFASLLVTGVIGSIRYAMRKKPNEPVVNNETGTALQRPIYSGQGLRAQIEKQNEV